VTHTYSFIEFFVVLSNTGKKSKRFFVLVVTYTGSNPSCIGNVSLDILKELGSTTGKLHIKSLVRSGKKEKISVHEFNK
jgi:hypothetical protein